MSKTMAAVVAVGTILAACAGADDDSGVEQTSDESETADVDAGRTGDGAEGGDAEGEFSRPATTAAPNVAPPEAAEETEAMEEAEDAASADDSEFDADFEPGEDRSAPVDVEGDGLFDESPDDAEDRFDDNRFQDYGYREFIATTDDPLSTFALDVDTGSYSIARRYLDERSLPPIESVRPEEYVNAFDYDYDAPRDGLDISVDGGPSPFDDDNVLVRVGVQGEVVEDEDRGPAALTFVIDTSGSMDRDDRLGLVKESLGVLVDELNDDDTVAIVTYSDDSGVVLEPTPVRDSDRILDAIDELGPGGSTNLESGLREGYGLAREAFDSEGINRVVLASDGVANSGVTDPDDLAAMIREDADEGIDLVTVGFGMGNFNDVTMEQLADNGDGFYAYVDTIDEAERLFEDELTSTLLTVAKDAKIQVEFDEQFVESYRLIGFENRGVRDSDFRDDTVDAGELGAGHQVTAMYELDLVDDVSLDDRAELGIVALRWEDPASGEVTEIDEDVDLRDIEPQWFDTADDFQLATVVATLAEKLRDNPYADDVDIDALAEEVDRLADVLDDDDVDELADLTRQAADLSS
ncbi:vWA domain-containing protein [Ilumatobacter nonamiensis]|uniref:vWA domain-containing protein n=1 Tax=Ilumatobacter nonamiensis TaxID=467093 RepID=UPI0011D2A195|nr:VWA domain-containing protein [Ilumatobacter nonamiensis]